MKKKMLCFFVLFLQVHKLFGSDLQEPWSSVFATVGFITCAALLKNFTQRTDLPLQKPWSFFTVEQPCQENVFRVVRLNSCRECRDNVQDLTEFRVYSQPKKISKKDLDFYEDFLKPILCHEKFSQKPCEKLRKERLDDFNEKFQGCWQKFQEKKFLKEAQASGYEFIAKDRFYDEDYVHLKLEDAHK